MTAKIKRNILRCYKECLVDDFNIFIRKRNYLYGYLSALCDAGVIEVITEMRITNYFTNKLDIFRGYDKL